MDAKNGIIEIKGISIPNNSYEFFLPLFDLIDKYVSNPASKTVVNLQFEYLNTSTSKALLELFKKLVVLDSVEFNWHYGEDDEEMFEFGKNYEALLECPFNFYEFSMN